MSYPQQLNVSWQKTSDTTLHRERDSPGVVKPRGPLILGCSLARDLMEKGRAALVKAGCPRRIANEEPEMGDLNAGGLERLPRP